jgi:hypothetical protein
LKSERIAFVMVGLLLGVATVGCRERNPAYIQTVEPADAGSTGPSDAFVPDLGRADSAKPSPDLPPSRDTGPLKQDGDVDAGVTGPDLAPPSDGAPVLDAENARDARDGRRPQDDASEADAPADAVLDVPAPLDLPNAEVGRDGVATDTPSARDASFDLPVACKDGDTASCASASNPLVGACHAGTRTCSNGSWGACVGEVLPATAELCNGLDDTCNGLTDEGCSENCVVVAPTGDDSVADGTSAHPFATIAAAMALATQTDGGISRRVCVAGGASCQESHAYALDKPLQIANGSRIQGNYALGNAGLTYCAGTAPPTTGIAFTASEQGVVFDATVTSATELGGFSITRFSTSSGPTLADTAAAVIVDGAKQVLLSGIFVTDAPTAGSTYGVDIENGGQATILASSIGGGQGRAQAVGVYVNNGQVTLRDNCDKSAQGICQSSCFGSGNVLGIWGRVAVATGDAFTDSSAVFVTGASSKASTIAANMICAGPGNVTGQSRGSQVAAIRCESVGCSSIRGNVIGGGLGKQTVALALSSASPSVEGNLLIGGCGVDSTTAVLAESSGVSLINNRIFGGECSGGNTSGSYVGVRLSLGAGGTEPIVHSNDIDPVGSADDCTSTGVLIERTAGDLTALGVLRNNIVATGDCRTRVAISEAAQANARLVENNDLYARASLLPVDVPIVLYQRGATSVTDIDKVNALSGASGNISQDPKFVAYPGDLRLASGSPCVDRGTAAGAPASDGAGNPRPAGAGFDIGAYELTSP